VSTCLPCKKRKEKEENEEGVSELFVAVALPFACIARVMENQDEMILLELADILCFNEQTD